jgi:hypothetical protein
MAQQRPEGEAAALKALTQYQDPRFQALDRLERYVSTTQYEGRVNWYDDSKPLWERAPCIAYPIVQAAISSNVDLLFGDGRCPTVTAASDQNDDEAAADEALEQRFEDIDRGVAELIEKARLWAAFREAYGQAQGARTAVCILGVRDGNPFVDTVKAKWCTPKLDNAGNVLSIEIRYCYLDRVKLESGKWQVQAKLYRRTIDAARDVTYVPAPATPDGREPKTWVEDAALTVAHGLGFCPVVWYAYRKGCSAVNEIDGKALHEHCLDEIEAHDIALSQRHTAALFMVPQICEIGVTPGYNPTDEGQKPDLLGSMQGGLPNGAVDGVPNQIRGSWTNGRKPGGARKKGPGYVWQYPVDTKVQLLALEPGALDALDKHAHDLRVKIAESLQVVFLDPENLKFAASVSGKALRILRERQFAHSDVDREDIGDGLVLRVLNLFLRMVEVLGKGAVRLKFLDKLLAALKGFPENERPSLSLVWPDYVSASADDELKTVQLVAAAKVAGILPRHTLVEKLVGVFSIENVNALLAELDDENAEDAKRQGALEHALNRVAATGTGGTPQGGGADEAPAGIGARSGTPVAPATAA